jgi:hypothetical protein
MTDLTRQARAAAAQVRLHGEPVILPAGAAVGVFERYDPRIQADQSEIGRALRPSQQPNPVLRLIDADAAGIAEGAAVTARGAQWRVTRLDVDGFGVTTLSLAPAKPTDAGDDWRRWR